MIGSKFSNNMVKNSVFGNMVDSDTCKQARLCSDHSWRCYLQEMFRDESTRNWFAQCGREMISDLLIQAERVREHYDKM